MKTVYLALEGFPYEGEEVLAAFDDEDKAKKYIELLKSELDPYDNRYFSIREFQVQ